MATSHNPGQGERLLNIGRRTQSALLDARRQQEADIRDAVYIQPLGNGRHLVKNFCNEQSYKVGSALGSLTFTPGQSVLLASHTGHPGEVIVGLPPIGKRGASFSPIIRHSRSRGTVPAEPLPACPVLSTSGTYYGFDTNSTHLRLWPYTHTTIGTQIANVDFSAQLSSVDSSLAGTRVWFNRSNTFVFPATTLAGHLAICTYVVGGSIVVNEMHSDLDGFSTPTFIVAGSTVYVFVADFADIYPMTMSIGDSGSNGAGFTNTLGSSGGGAPLSIDLSGPTDPVPSATLAEFNGVPYLDWFSADSPAHVEWFSWFSDPPASVLDWGEISATFDLGAGLENLYTLPVIGALRWDGTTLDQALIVTAVGTYRVCGLPSSWVGNFQSEPRATSAGDVLVEYDDANPTRDYLRLPAGYFAAGVTVSDECPPPMLTFDPMPSSSFAPAAMFPLT